jgi:hypothetical protein
MSEWCRDHLDARMSTGPSSLGPERRYHLQALIKLDPDHAQARAFLGYTRENGVWINLEQMRLGHGFVLQNRRWMTREEVELAEAEEAWKDRQIEWTRRLKRLRSSKNDEAQIRAELAKINDPAAVQPVIELLEKEKVDAWQWAWVDVLGNIHNAASARALSDIAVMHENRTTREMAVARLKQEQFDQVAAADYVARQYLNHKDNEPIQQAGFVLGEIGDFSVVLPLIDSLVTIHIVPNPRAGNPGSISPSFSSDGSVGMQQGNSEPRLLKLTKQNHSVLDALRRLTQADFGFSKDAWRQWYAGQHSLVDVDVRRDE